MVPRELTAEEIAKRDAEIKKEKDAEAAGVARKRKDQELTKLYASPRDVEEARDRKVLSIDTAMATTEIEHRATEAAEATPRATGRRP